jgi:hypothetical protein
VRTRYYRATMLTVVRPRELLQAVLVAAQLRTLLYQCAECRARVLLLHDRDDCCTTVRATDRSSPCTIVPAAVQLHLLLQHGPTAARVCHYHTIMPTAVDCASCCTIRLAVVQLRSTSHHCADRCALVLLPHDPDHCLATRELLHACARRCATVRTAAPLCKLPRERATTTGLCSLLRVRASYSPLRNCAHYRTIARRAARMCQ